MMFWNLVGKFIHRTFQHNVRSLCRFEAHYGNLIANPSCITTKFTHSESWMWGGHDLNKFTFVACFDDHNSRHSLMFGMQDWLCHKLTLKVAVYLLAHCLCVFRSSWVDYVMDSNVIEGNEMEEALNKNIQNQLIIASNRNILEPSFLNIVPDIVLSSPDRHSISSHAE